MSSVSEQIQLCINSINSNGVRKQLDALSQIVNFLDTYKTKEPIIQSVLETILNHLNNSNNKIQLKAIYCLNLIINIKSKENVKWILKNEILSHLFLSLKTSNSSLVIEKLAELLRSIFVTQTQCKEKIFETKGLEIILKKVIYLSQRKKKDAFYDIAMTATMELLPPLQQIIQQDFVSYWDQFDLNFRSFISCWTNKLKAKHKIIVYHIKTSKVKSIRCECGCPLLYIIPVFHSLFNFMANINCACSITDSLFTEFSEPHRKYIKYIIKLDLPRIIYKYLVLSTQCAFNNHLFRDLLIMQISSMQFVHTFLQFCYDGKYAKFLFSDGTSLLNIAYFIFSDSALQEFKECPCNEECEHVLYPIDEVKCRTHELLSYFYVSNGVKRTQFVDKLLKYKNGQLLQKIIIHCIKNRSIICLITSIIKYSTLCQCKQFIKHYLFLFKCIPDLYANLIGIISVRLEMLNDNRPLEPSWTDLLEEYILNLSNHDSNHLLVDYEYLLCFVQLRNYENVEYNELYWMIVSEFLNLDPAEMRKSIKYKRKYLKIRFKDIFCGYWNCQQKNHKVNNTKLCSGCRMVYYCCSNHQKKDWNYGGHRFICTVLKPFVHKFIRV